MKCKRGDIPITILTIGVFTLCTFCLLSFSLTTIKTRTSFVGLDTMETLNSQIESASFYGDAQARNIMQAVAYAKKSNVIGRTCKCGDDCENYASLILDICNKEGIDPILFLSLMMQESSCKASVASDSSVGLMQINLDNCGKYTLSPDREICKKELINNPELNIQVGAKILKEKYNLFPKGNIFSGCANRGITYTGWEAAIRGYNGWGCNEKYPAQDYFVDEVIKRYKILNGEYLEKDITRGMLWWAKKTTAFSVEYQGKQ